MADNVTLNAGAGGDIIAADDVSGVKYQMVKIVPGGDGLASVGGGSSHTLSSAATTNATSVKGSAGTIYHLSITNTNASARYIRFYNKASAPTVGTDTVVYALAIPGSGGATINFTYGLPFSTGIAYSLTADAANSGTTAVAADEIKVNIVYV